MAFDVYQTITDSIIATIEKGDAEGFEMPWHRGSGDGFPINANTSKPYNGINVLSLWVAQQVKGFKSREWATFKQWQDKGAQVRKGEKASHVIFYRELEEGEKEDGSTEDGPRRSFIARASFVFNADQVDGYTQTATAPKVADGADDLGHVEAFLKASGADIRHGGDRAYYAPSSDYIQLPHKADFYGSKHSSPTEAYYSTALHELTHWTGHKTRLDRLGEEFQGKRGKEGYAFEELIAELGASFLCADLGVSVEPRLDHAQYINGWLKVLKDDKKAIFSAASHASKAARFIHERAAPVPTAPAVADTVKNDYARGLA